MPALSETLAELLGGDAVAQPGTLGGYSVDGVAPQAVALPSRVESVSDVMRLASREGWAVVPRGGGTQMSLGNVPSRVDLVLGLERMDRLVFHEPADMVASAEAGMAMDAFQRELARHGQTLPLEAPMASRATLAGVLASNASGPSRLACGTARDWLIGVKVVRPSGEITRSGGRVVKNVTGYDLNKLYTGSLGTLGVIVEATFKVAPLPRRKGTLVAAFSSLHQALESSRTLLEQHGQPQALQVVDREVALRLPVLSEVSPNEAGVVALFSGSESSVARVLSDAKEVLGRSGTAEVTTLMDEDGDGLWRAITDLGWSEEGAPELMAKVSLLPSQVAPFISDMEGAALPQWRRGLIADPGFGLVRLLGWTDSTQPEALKGIDAAIGDLRSASRPYGGHAVIERCPVLLKRGMDVWDGAVDGLDVMRRVKGALDPAGIMSPGRFVGGM